MIFASRVHPRALMILRNIRIVLLLLLVLVLVFFIVIIIIIIVKSRCISSSRVRARLPPTANRRGAVVVKWWSNSGQIMVK